MTLKEKKEKRAGLVVQMRASLDKASAEKRDLTAEETATYEAIEKDVDRLGREINREEALAGVENALRSQRDSAYRPGIETDGKKRARASDEYKRAFLAGFMRHGKNNLGPEFLNVLTEGADVDGGYLVPDALETAIVKKLYELNPIRQVATVRTTALDTAIPVRTGIPTFAWLGEGGTYGKVGSTYGRVALVAHKCGGIIPISDELLQDSMENMEAEINETAGLAFDELESTGFLTGNGVGCPEGLFHPTTVSGTTIPVYTGAVSATAAITGDDIIETFHKLGPQYRTSATWLMHDTTAKLIRKLKGEDNQYLWQPGLQLGQPDIILGRRVVICRGAPEPAASTKTICFGNLSAYRIMDRLGIAVKTLNELYAENGQVGFRFTRRTDGKLTDANAVAFFKHGAAA